MVVGAVGGATAVDYEREREEERESKTEMNKIMNRCEK